MGNSEIYYCRILVLCTGIALGALYTGYNTSVLNIAYKPLVKACKWTKEESDKYHGLVVSFYQLGAAFVCPFVGIVVDKIGRINTLIIAELIGCVGTIFYMFFNIYPILIGRLISGIAAASFSVCVPLYVRELSPKEISGLLGTIYSFFLRLASAIGFSFVFGFNSDYSNYGYLRFVLGFPILILILQLVIVKLIFNVESPRKLYASNNLKQCKKNIELLYSSSERVEKEIEVVKKNVEVASKNTEISLKEVLSRKFIYALIVMICIHILQQCSLGPTLLMYSNTVFEKAHISQSLANVATLFVGLVSVDGVYSSSVILDYVGRRRQLIIGSIFLSLFLFLLTLVTYQDDKLLEIVCIQFIIMSYSLSYGSVTWVYQSEILYSKAQGISSVFHWLAQFGVSLLFPFMLNSTVFGRGKLFLVFGFILFLGIIFSIFVVKETKQRNEFDNRFLYTNKELRN